MVNPFLPLQERVKLCAQSTQCRVREIGRAAGCRSSRRREKREGAEDDESDGGEPENIETDEDDDLEDNVADGY